MQLQMGHSVHEPDRAGLVGEARTQSASNMLAANDDTDVVATGGIDLDDKFRPKFEGPLCRNLYGISIPFLLHKPPFVQGITSAEELAPEQPPFSRRHPDAGRSKGPEAGPVQGTFALHSRYWWSP